MHDGGSSASCSCSDYSDSGPWANLLPELCNPVLDRVDALGVIHFPKVFSDWAAASKNTLHPHLLTSEGYDIEYDLEHGAFGLHDVAIGKSHYCEAKGLKKRTWVGSKDDLLLTTDLRCSIEFLNPITGDRVPLPSFTTIPCDVVVEDSAWPRYLLREMSHPFQRVVPPSWFRSPEHLLKKVTLCRTLAHRSGYLTILFSGDVVAFTAADHNRWMLLKNPLKDPERLYSLNTYTDIIVHKGTVLAIARSRNIYSSDMDYSKSSEPTVLSPPNINIDNCTRRVATSSSDDLQLVRMAGFNDKDADGHWWRIVFDFEQSFRPRRVLLHELDAVSDAWRRIKNLGGDHALFVWANYPFYADVPRDGSAYPLLQADCVYVVDLINCNAGIFYLRLGDDFEFSWDAHLYYPTMEDPLQMPMWFRPAAVLRKSTSAHTGSCADAKKVANRITANEEQGLMAIEADNEDKELRINNRVYVPVISLRYLVVV